MAKRQSDQSNHDLAILDKIADIDEDPFELNNRVLSSNLDLSLFPQNNDSKEPSTKKRKLEDLLKAIDSNEKAVFDLTSSDNDSVHGSPDEDPITVAAPTPVSAQIPPQQQEVNVVNTLSIQRNIDESKETEETQRLKETQEALENLDFTIDPIFRKALKKHQVEGLKFMWRRVYKNRGGCLLAHSMGLGKTLQTIALLTTMYQELRRNPSTQFPTGKRVLIIAPLITLSNWALEFGKWAIANADNLIGEVFNFAELGRDAANSRLRVAKYWYSEGGVMLINYDMFRSLVASSKNSTEKDEYMSMFVNPGPDVVVLDEAHRIKNSTSNVSNLINRIHTSSRICLTGYPLQNHISEYYDMLSFVAPGLLGESNSFKAYFRHDIEGCYADSSTAVKRQAAMKLYVLQLLTEAVTHRRDENVLKLDLPIKTEYVVRLKMSPFQFDGYEKLIKFSTDMNPMVALLTLRAVCNHPKIFQDMMKERQVKQRNADLDKEYGNRLSLDDMLNSSEQDDLDTTNIAEENEMDAFEAFLSKEYEWAIKYFNRTDVETWKCSGKMSFIVELAKGCQVIKDKLVIVSHSLACLKYIEELMPVLNIKTLRIDGATPAGERQNIIDRFETNKDIDIMLLSAKAAAIGINLTTANRVVLVDQDWNPLYDEQSIGRVYRYGQMKPVFVYRLVTASTIEERIFAQSVHKKSIAQRVIDNKRSMVISREELVEYFVPPDASVPAIDLDKVVEDIKKEYITWNALKESADCIAEVKTYENEPPTKDDCVFYTLNDEERMKAREEAKQLIRDWWKKYNVSGDNARD